MNHPITWSLCVELDMGSTPPVVKDVVVICFNGHPPYKPHAGYEPGVDNYAHGPRAVLTEVSARGNDEAMHALKGIIEHDEHLAWVRDYPHVRQFLNPSPFQG